MAGRLRLNVSALAGEDVVAKFLVVVDEQSGVDVLKDKIEKALRRGGVQCGCTAVQNTSGSSLPEDEQLGDMLRDGEELLALLPLHGVGEVPGAAALPQPVERLRTTLLAQAATQPAAPPAAAPPTEPIAGAPSPPPSEPVTIAAQPEAAACVDPSAVHAVITLPHDMLRAQVESVLQEQLRKQTLQRKLQQAEAEAESSSEGDDGRDTEAPPRVLGRAFAAPPGPREAFEEETRRFPGEELRVDHPTEPMQPETYDNDWLVDKMTPRLRDYIMERFQGDLITEPKYVPALGKYVSSRFLQDCGAFVSVFMRPQSTVGSDRNRTMPVHYNVPRGDINAFQRKAEAHIDEAQQHLGLFRAALFRLTALLSKGKAESETIDLILPHTYEVYQEVEGVMLEIDRPLLPLGRSGGCNPVIVVDTAGPVGSHLTYVKAALKRALHAHVKAKSSFQLIRFLPTTGDPRLWSKAMERPREESIGAAEDWIDSLVPVRDAHLLKAIHYALAHQSCDEIYIVSSGGCPRTQAHGQMLADIQRLNTREVPIHTVAVNPETPGELLLRNIAESNHGDFASKWFGQDDGSPGGDAISARDARWTSWRTNLVNEKTREMTERFKAQRMSIRSQIRILEVMQREEERAEAIWREEWRCAQRLLFANEEEKLRDLNTRDAVKEMERRTSRTLSARVGGGYAYMNGERELGMEHLFEHKTAAPWTDVSDTAAAGPRVPRWDAGQARLPRAHTSSFPTLAPDAPAPRPSFRTSSLRGALGVAAGSGAAAAQAVAAAGGAPPARGRASSPAPGSNPWASSAAGRRRTPKRRRAASADRAAGARRTRTPQPPSQGTPGTLPQQRASGPLPPPAPATDSPSGGDASPPAVRQRRWSF